MQLVASSAVMGKRELEIVDRMDAMTGLDFYHVQKMALVCLLKKLQSPALISILVS